MAGRRSNYEYLHTAQRTSFGIVTSDGDKTTHPDDPEPDDPLDCIRWIEVTDASTERYKKKAKHWRDKLGSAFAKHVMNTDPVLLAELGPIDPDTCTLAEFPDGYAFHVRVRIQPKAPGSTDTKIRDNDSYLFGFKRGFRSPEEFFPHLLWLARNAPSNANTTTTTRTANTNTNTPPNIEYDKCECVQCGGTVRESGAKYFHKQPKSAPRGRACHDEEGGMRMLLRAVRDIPPSPGPNRTSRAAVRVPTPYERPTHPSPTGPRTSRDILREEGRRAPSFMRRRSVSPPRRLPHPSSTARNERDDSGRDYGRSSLLRRLEGGSSSSGRRYQGGNTSSEQRYAGYGSSSSGQRHGYGSSSSEQRLEPSSSASAWRGRLSARERAEIHALAHTARDERRLDPDSDGERDLRIHGAAARV